MSNEEIVLNGYLQKSAADGTLMETLKELGVNAADWAKENPELAGGIAGGLGGATVGALGSGKGNRLRTAILSGLAGTAGGAGMGYLYDQKQELDKAKKEVDRLTEIIKNDPDFRQAGKNLKLNELQEVKEKLDEELRKLQ